MKEKWNPAYAIAFSLLVYPVLFLISYLLVLFLWLQWTKIPLGPIKFYFHLVPEIGFSIIPHWFIAWMIYKSEYCKRLRAAGIQMITGAFLVEKVLSIVLLTQVFADDVYVDSMDEAFLFLARFIPSYDYPYYYIVISTLISFIPYYVYSNKVKSQL